MSSANTSRERSAQSRHSKKRLFGSKNNGTGSTPFRSTHQVKLDGERKLHFVDNSSGNNQSDTVSSNLYENTSIAQNRSERFLNLGLQAGIGNSSEILNPSKLSDDSHYLMKLCKANHTIGLENQKKFITKKPSFAAAERKLSQAKTERKEAFSYTNTQPFQQFELDNYELNWWYISKMLFELKNKGSEQNQVMSAAVINLLFLSLNDNGIYFSVSPTKEEQLLQSFDINFKQSKLKTASQRIFKDMDFRRSYIQEFEHQLIQRVNQEGLRRSLFLLEQEELLKLKMMTEYKKGLNEQLQKERENENDQWFASFDSNMAVAAANRKAERDRKWLIKIIDHSKLDELQSPFLLQSLIAKTEVEGVHLLFDWGAIEEKTRAFDQRVTPEVRYEAQVLQKVLDDVQYEWIFAIEIEKINCKMVIDQEILNRVQYYEPGIRQCNLRLLYKSACFEECGLLDIVMEEVFWSEYRFKAIENNYQSQNKLDHIQNRELQFIDKLDGFNFCFKFGDYSAYAYIFNKNYETFTDMVFKHKHQTIYKLLHQIENDSIMYTMTQHLYTQTCYRFYKMPIMTSGAYEKLFGFQGGLEYKMPFRRAKSQKTLTIKQIREHSTNQLINFNGLRQKGLEAQSEVATTSKYSKVSPNNVMKRQNALNYFNKEMCQFLIHDLLHKGNRIIKGSVLLYYKRPFRWSLKGFSPLMREKMEVYGFKVNVARNSMYPLMIMEVLQPVKFSVAERKIVQNSTVLNNSKPKPSPYLPILKQWKERDHWQLPAKKMTKELRYFEPEKFDTDESMREIDFDDVKSNYSGSDFSDDSQYSSIMKQNKKCLLMSDMKTALEYYNYLNMPRKRQPVKVKVFKAVQDNEYDKHDGNRRNKTINQIQQLLNEAQGHVTEDNINKMLLNNRDRDYFDETIRKCFQVEDFNQTFFKQENVRVNAKLKSGIIDFIECSIPNFSDLLEGTNRHYIKKLSKLISSGNPKWAYFIQEEIFDTKNETKMLKLRRGAKEQKMLAEKRKQYRNNLHSKHTTMGGKREWQVDQERKKLKTKLHQRMKTVNAFLGNSSSLELENEKYKPEEKPQVKKLYSDPEQMKALKREVFLTVLSKDYTKIEDLFLRYFLTADNITTDRGDNLLMVATHIEDPKLVNYLLHKGFDPNKQNANGDTALHFALNRMLFKIADSLIHYGADETIKNNQAKTPWDLVKI